MTIKNETLIFTTQNNREVVILEFNKIGGNRVRVQDINNEEIFWVNTNDITPNRFFWKED